MKNKKVKKKIMEIQKSDRALKMKEKQLPFNQILRQPQASAEKVNITEVVALKFRMKVMFKNY